MTDPTPAHPATDEPSPGHSPVMPDRVLDLLNPSPGDDVLDCTLGRGGHAERILPRIRPGGRYIGLDLDPANLAAARARLAPFSASLQLHHANFADARSLLDSLAIPSADLILADLGFASTQVDDPARGLSFTRDGPLDMRLDPRASLTAADLVNESSERDLADLIFRFGEERFSRRIARKIVARRASQPIHTTGELAGLCASAYGPTRRRSRIHPATRTFQALRIAVNDELGNLDRLLSDLPRLASPGARVAFIAFHSLEDRLVKQAFRSMAERSLGEVLTRKPLTPDDTEINANPRSRSAKLRAFRFNGPDRLEANHGPVQSPD